MIKDFYVIIITARPDYQKNHTLKSFKDKLGGWMPDEMYFQDENDRPPVAKEKLLQKYIIPRHGLDGKYLALKATPKPKKCIKNTIFHQFQYMMRENWN